ncbi:UNVERIFIED_CONTAM: hypothetical protein FKN15_008110 [Acipenser sinensis]
MDTSDRATPVRFLDTDDDPSLSKVPGLPELHEGGPLLLGSSGLSSKRAEAGRTACFPGRRGQAWPSGFPLVDSTIAALFKAPLVGGLARDLEQMHRVLDADKAALLDKPISPGHTFGPALQEILPRSHWEREASRQVAVLLPPRAPAWGRSNRRRAPQTRTVTRAVPVPTAPLGDLRHRVQGTPAANNRPLPTSRGNAGHGQSTHQCSRRWFQGHHPRQPPQPQLPSRDPEGLRPQNPFSAHQLHYWHACTSDTWVLTTVQNGYVLQFLLGTPPFREITNTFVTDPLQASSQEGAVAHTAVVTQHLARQGLTINDAKSLLTAVQCTTYLGLRLDSSMMHAYLLDDRTHKKIPYDFLKKMQLEAVRMMSFRPSEVTD